MFGLEPKWHGNTEQDETDRRLSLWQFIFESMFYVRSGAAALILLQRKFMLTIFDIDGTVCDTQKVEGRCFAQAFKDVCGISLDTLEWTQYDEPTSSGVVRAVLSNTSCLERKERDIRDRFVHLLAEEKPKFPGDFSPISGAIEFIKNLSQNTSVTVAFATGGFDTEATFKLKCCGIDISDFPHATSSDTPRRRDFIPLASKRAGCEISSAIYFGDAPWDVKACAGLGIPMIGIGRRIDQLKILGLAHVFRDFSNPTDILEAIRQIKETEGGDGDAEEAV